MGTEWTLSTLKALVDERDVRYAQRFQAQQEALTAALSAAEKAVAAALSAADRAVNKAEIASEKRFDSVNEFRQALADQTNTLVSRNEYATAHQGVIERMDRLEKAVALASGRAEQRLNDRADSRTSMGLVISMVVAAIFAVGTIVSVVALILKP